MEKKADVERFHKIREPANECHKSFKWSEIMREDEQILKGIAEIIEIKKSPDATILMAILEVLMDIRKKLMEDG